MINSLRNSAIYQSMETFDELDDPTQFLMREFSSKLDCSFNDYQGLQSKYSSLHESYAKEMENTKKVEKCLVKCLKFYSKLSKKYEVQQKVVGELEKSVKEKTQSLEESLKNEEKMRGLIEIYKSERSIYLKESVESLKKDKEILLDICCRLIKESVKNNNTRNLTNLLLKKFRRDLDDEKLNMLKFKNDSIKKEIGKCKESDFTASENQKSFCMLNVPFSAKGISKTEGTNWKLSEKCSDDCSVFEDKYKINVDKIEQRLELLDSLTKYSLDSSEEDKISEKNYRGKDLEGRGKDVNAENSNTKEYSLSSCVKVEKKDKYFSIEEKCKNCDMPFIDVPSDHSDFEEDNKELECELDFLRDSRNTAFHNKGKNAAICKDLSKGGFEYQDDLWAKEGSNSLKHKDCEEDKSTTSKALEDKEVSRIQSEISKTVISSPSIQYLSESCNGRSIFDFTDDKNETNTIDIGNSGIGKSITCSEPGDIFEIGFSTGPSFLQNASGSNGSGSLQLPSLFTNLENPVIGNKKKISDCFPKNLKIHTIKQLVEVNETEFLEERNLDQIFKDMSVVRLLSPIREIANSLPESERSDEDKTLDSISQSLDSQGKSVYDRNDSTEKHNLAAKKRHCSTASDSADETHKNKKLKVEESFNCFSKNDSIEKNEGLLDSILSAMSVQNEEFKSSVKNKVSPATTDSGIASGCNITGFEKMPNDSCRLPVSDSTNYSRGRKGALAQNSKEASSVPQTRSLIKEKQIIERVIMDEIKKFVSSPIISKEEADKNVKHCLSVLMNKSEETIARVIVGIVFENVDENVEIFERPAPPLTNTQHRLMVLLSVFKTLDPNSEKILSFILDIISEKLFPDNFFWPDDCVEMACRFYTALCKTRNDTKTLWKFCLRAMIEMKQRSCMIVFTVLKTWPDVLHNASTLQNNILAVTIVNIFLHMPKSEGLRNHNQKKKLMALKHLLMNFYQFKVDNTMEIYAQKVYDKVLKDETGSNKSLVLLAKCRDWNWTSKHILSKIKETLKSWAQDEVEDAVGINILSVIKELTVSFFKENGDAISQVKEIIFCLSNIIRSRKKSHLSEQTIIEVLLGMKQDAEARKVIREWVPKVSISENLKNEIINVSADNILRELKLNPKKNSPEKKIYGKQKKQKKPKGKKKKAKKRKNN